MEAVQSYHRKIRTVSTTNGQPWEEYNEFAYAKDPFLEYILLDYPQQSTRNETLIIGDIYYDRMNDEKWNKVLPGNWFTERPQEFRYELSTQYYPIDYGKLTLQASGNETVNGMDCTKYVVSGGYEDEYTDRDIKYRIKLSGTGEIWISNDAVIKQVLIRQRLKLNADIQTVELKDKDGNLLHAVYEDVIEDDVYDINNTVIQPPPDSEVIVMWGESEEVSEVPDNISAVEGLDPGSVTQEQSEPWTAKAWETEYGRIKFEWINGYLLGSFVWSDNSKIESSLQDHLIGIVEGNKLSGDATYDTYTGVFEFVLDPDGKSFSGRWKLSIHNDWVGWNGQSSD